MVYQTLGQAKEGEVPIVYVLPDPVWPYAKTVALNPAMTWSIKGRTYAEERVGVLELESIIIIILHTTQPASALSPKIQEGRKYHFRVYVSLSCRLIKGAVKNM